MLYFGQRLDTFDYTFYMSFVPVYCVLRNYLFLHDEMEVERPWLNTQFFAPFLDGI